MTQQRKLLMATLFLLAAVITLMNGCRSKSSRTWHSDTFTVCEGRSILAADDPEICFTPKFWAYLGKHRPDPFTTEDGEYINLGVISFTWYAPDYSEAHSGLFYELWTWYKQAIIYGAGSKPVQPLRYYWDPSKGLPQKCICGDWETDWWVDNPAKALTLNYFWTDDKGRIWLNITTHTIY